MYGANPYPHFQKTRVSKMKRIVRASDIRNACESHAKLVGNMRLVVLCKNCKYAEEYDPFGIDLICNNNKHTIVDYVSPDWFCADGVERDKGDEHD